MPLLSVWNRAIVHWACCEALQVVLSCLGKEKRGHGLLGELWKVFVVEFHPKIVFQSVRDESSFRGESGGMQVSLES